MSPKQIFHLQVDRDFLIQYNGGAPNPNCFYFKDYGEKGSLVDGLFGIKKDKNYNLLIPCMR